MNKEPLKRYRIEFELLTSGDDPMRHLIPNGRFVMDNLSIKLIK